MGEANKCNIIYSLRKHRIRRCEHFTLKDSISALQSLHVNAFGPEALLAVL